MNKKLVIGEYRLLELTVQSLVQNTKIVHDKFGMAQTDAMEQHARDAQKAVESGNMLLILKKMRQIKAIYRFVVNELSLEQLASYRIWIDGIDLDMRHAKIYARSLHDWE